MKQTDCTINNTTVLSNKQSRMSDEPTSRELTEEELELVVGGQSRETFERFRCGVINALNYEVLREDEQQQRG